jgi:hypothetical protein
MTMKQTTNHNPASHQANVCTSRGVINTLLCGQEGVLFFTASARTERTLWQLPHTQQAKKKKKHLAPKKEISRETTDPKGQGKKTRQDKNVDEWLGVINQRMIKRHKHNSSKVKKTRSQQPQTIPFLAGHVVVVPRKKKSHQKS